MSAFVGPISRFDERLCPCSSLTVLQRHFNQFFSTNNQAPVVKKKEPERTGHGER